MIENPTDVPRVAVMARSVGLWLALANLVLLAHIGPARAASQPDAPDADAAVVDPEDATGGGAGTLDAASADALLQRLSDFTSDLSTLSASFEQALYDENDEPLQQSSGNVQIKRPGKFFWRYEEPDRQDIVTDGQTLWLYDHELEQVTVSPVDERISGTPLVLLTGGTPLDEQFTIEPLGGAEGIDWLELTPREDGSDFESVFIGLDDDGIAAMELQDSFGQATQIRFSNVATNQSIDDTTFQFEPPDGVDVIGENSQ